VPPATARHTVDVGPIQVRRTETRGAALVEHDVAAVGGAAVAAVGPILLQLLADVAAMPDGEQHWFAGFVESDSGAVVEEAAAVAQAVDVVVVDGAAAGQE